MIALHDFWAQNPVDYVKHVMKVSGLTPQQIGLDSAAQTQPGQQPAGDPPPSAEPEWVDPAVVALRQQYEQDKQQLQRELASLRQTLTGAQEASAQEKVLSAQTIIDRFIDETDDSGEPAHPHFEAVQDHMERLLKHDPSISAMPPGPEKLQAAYDVATWMHPEARAARLEAESRTQQAIWEAQRTRAAATVKPKAAPAGGAATPKPTTLDAMIRQAASKFGI
jgi:hypothetical protein